MIVSRTNSVNLFLKNEKNQFKFEKLFIVKSYA